MDVSKSGMTGNLEMYNLMFGSFNQKLQQARIQSEERQRWLADFRRWNYRKEGQPIRNILRDAYFLAQRPMLRLIQEKMETMLEENERRLYDGMAEHMQHFCQNFFSPKIMLHVLEGGKAPERSTADAVGYDCYLRGLVNPDKNKHDPHNKHLRETLYDFIGGPETALSEKIGKRVSWVKHGDEKTDDCWGYTLMPGESIMVDVGFVSAMPFPMFFWIAPRSGLASLYQITVANAPGTVDPGFRGAAGVLVCNRGDKPFILEKHMRIAQGIFCWAIMPNMEEILAYESLPKSPRQGGGFGFTGLKELHIIEKMPEPDRWKIAASA